MNFRRLVSAHVPLSLKPGWRETARRGVDPLLQADAAEEPAQLKNDCIIVLVLRQVNLLLWGGADEPLGMAVLPGFTNVGPP